MKKKEIIRKLIILEQRLSILENKLPEEQKQVEIPLEEYLYGREAQYAEKSR